MIAGCKMIDSMTIKLDETKWFVQASDGILIGSGEDIEKVLKCSPKVFGVVESIAETLYGNALTNAALYDLHADSVPKAVFENILRLLLDSGLVQSIRSTEGETKAEARSHEPICILCDDDYASTVRRIFVEQPPKGRSSFAFTVKKITEVESYEDGHFQEFALIVGIASNSLSKLRFFPYINEKAILEKTPLLLAYANGEKSYIGPLVLPGETACYRCVEIREKNNAKSPEYFSTLRSKVHDFNIRSFRQSSPACLIDAAFSVYQEVENFMILDNIPACYKHIVEREHRSLSSYSHPILKMPLCDKCGNFTTRQRVSAWAI